LLDAYPSLWLSTRYNLPTLQLITSTVHKTLSAAAADDDDGSASHEITLQYSLPLAAWAEAAAHDSSSSFPQALAVALSSTSSSYCPMSAEVDSWLQHLRSALPASDDDDDDDGNDDDSDQSSHHSSSSKESSCSKPLTIEAAHEVRGGELKDLPHAQL
jgi:hypothetical protein